jgi:hypothetical protein
LKLAAIVSAIKRFRENSGDTSRKQRGEDDACIKQSVILDPDSKHLGNNLSVKIMPTPAMNDKQ